MEYRKNDIVTLEIVDCGTDGEGIGKADGFTVFVCMAQNSRQYEELGFL